MTALVRSGKEWGLRSFDVGEDPIIVGAVGVGSSGLPQLQKEPSSYFYVFRVLTLVQSKTSVKVKEALQGRRQAQWHRPLVDYVQLKISVCALYCFSFFLFDRWAHR